MDFGITEDQIMIRDAAREFLAVECPPEFIRKFESDTVGHSPLLWSKLADLGWLGLLFPSQYGGEGLTFEHMVVLLEQTGSALIPGSFFSTTVLCGQAIMYAGTETQKQNIISGIVQGDLVLALALTEAAVSYEPDGVNLIANLSGDHYVLNGRKAFVSDAKGADYMLVAARTTRGVGREGISMLLVDCSTPGVKISPLNVLGLDKQYEVIFDGARVPWDNIVGSVGMGWDIVQKLMAWGAVGKCAESLGGCQVAMNMTIEYVKGRSVFGRSLGSFQSIQHRCADMLRDIETSRYVTYKAAYMLSQGKFDAIEVSIAKAWVNEAYKRVVSFAQQCHGGIGFIKEMDLHFYYKKARLNEVLFGDSVFHWRKIAESRF